MRKLNQGKTLSDPDFIIKKLPQFKHMLDDKLLAGKIEQRAYALYKLLSKWPHGDPQGMGMTFEHDGECFSLNDANCEYFGGCAIHLGVISLGRTAILFNDHFGLDFGERLAEFRKTILRVITSKNQGSLNLSIGSFLLPMSRILAYQFSPDRYFEWFGL